MTTAGASLSGAVQLIERHSESSSQRTHSFILLRVEMTVPKQSLTMRGTVHSRIPDVRTGLDRRPTDNVRARQALSTSRAVSAPRSPPCGSLNDPGRSAILPPDRALAAREPDGGRNA